MPNGGKLPAMSDVVGRMFAAQHGADPDGGSKVKERTSLSVELGDIVPPPSTEVPIHPPGAYGPLPIVPQQTIPGYRDYGVPQEPSQKDPLKTT